MSQVMHEEVATAESLFTRFLSFECEVSVKRISGGGDAHGWMLAELAAIT